MTPKIRQLLDAVESRIHAENKANFEATFPGKLFDISSSGIPDFKPVLEPLDESVAETFLLRMLNELNNRAKADWPDHEPEI